MVIDDDHRTLIELPYAPRDAFLPYHERTTRWAAMVCHRRAGKTVACINDLIRQALTSERKDWRGAYIAPYYAQSKDVAWGYVKQFTAPVPGVAWNESELRCDFPNGARIRLYGADGADVRMRGIYLDSVVLDEVADMHPSVWGEVIRPLLTDRKGTATFIGTPKGRNVFHAIWQQAQAEGDWFSLMLRASETGILPADELDAARRQMTPDQYAQEFECSFDAAITGAYYAAEIQRAEQDGRVAAVPYEPMLPVNTAWDLGIGDSMSIVMWQQERSGAIRVIDYYEASGYGLDHYVKMLDGRGYKWGKHFLPHDAKVRELGTGKSRVEVLQSLGVIADVLPALGVEDGINAVRMTLPKCWFDKTKTALLLEMLRQYRERRDDKRNVALGPLHDFTSHAADAFRYMVTALDRAKPLAMQPIKYDTRGIV